MNPLPLGDSLTTSSLRSTSINQIKIKCLQINKPIASDSTTDILALFQCEPAFSSMAMKPNNLVALLVVAILLAIGIALAVINQRSENDVPKRSSGSVTPANPAMKINDNGARFS